MRFVSTSAVPFAPVTASLADLNWDATMSLDCGAAYVRIPGMGHWMPPTDYTIECWNFSRGGGRDIAFNMEADEGGRNRVLAHVPWDNNYLYFDSGDLNTTGRLLYPAPPSLLNAWQHLAFQVDSQAGAMRIFLNGVLWAEALQCDTFKPQATDFLIGAAHLGLLGEFRLWNRVRAAAAIAADSTRALAGPRPGLLGCWRLNDTLEHGGRILDYSGYARHGILNHR
jgi:hypothetical protein